MGNLGWGGKWGGRMGGTRGGLGIGGGVTSPPSQIHHMVTTCAAKVPKSPQEHTIPEILEGWAVGAGCILVSIANELDREHLRNLRGETETEIVRNSKVLVDFEVRT